MVPRLPRGDYLPKIVTPPPGPRSRELSRALARWEAPGVNTLRGDRPNILWLAARGSNVLDVDGNRYIDLTSGFGVAAVGHRHPHVVEALRRQSATLIHGLGDAAAHLARVELAERLARITPVDDAQVYFAVSGADAVEIALKTAVLATGRPGVVAFEPAYHGLTLGALAVTSRDEFRQPFTAHLHGHVHRLPYGCDPGRVAEVLDDHDGDDGVGSLVVEPVVGREGVWVPPDGWLTRLAELCSERGVVMIADEIFTGFGRTGDFFAVEHEVVWPDLLCCGKALGGGMPIAAVVGRRDLLAAWATAGEALHTATFVAHPPACAAAHAMLDVLIEDDLPERARRLGEEEIGPRLRAWQDAGAVHEARGRGLVWGLDLGSQERAGHLVEAARQRGLLLLAGGPTGRVVQVVPPLDIHDRQLEYALETLEDLLTGEFPHCPPPGEPLICPTPGEPSSS